MNYSDYAIILNIVLDPDEVSPVIIGGQSAEEISGGQDTASPATTATTEAPTDVPAGSEAEAGLGSFIPMALIYAALFAAMYFLFFRPQRKQAKELKIMQKNIRPGDSIITQSGLYGKITDVGEDVFIVEFGINKGVRIPVAKSEVAAIKAPKMTPTPIAPPPKE